MTDQRPLLPVTQGLPTDKYGETAIDRIRDHAENGTMPPQFREDLRTLLRLSSEKDGWRPIAEGPKDFTDVLVYCPDYGGVIVAVYETNAPEPYWSTDVHDFSRERNACNPTHFRPLPSPPATPDSVGGEG